MLHNKHEAYFTPYYPSVGQIWSPAFLPLWVWPRGMNQAQNDHAAKRRTRLNMRASSVPLGEGCSQKSVTSATWCCPFSDSKHTNPTIDILTWLIAPNNLIYNNNWPHTRKSRLFPVVPDTHHVVHSVHLSLKQDKRGMCVYTQAEVISQLHDIPQYKDHLVLMGITQVTVPLLQVVAWVHSSQVRQ